MKGATEYAAHRIQASGLYQIQRRVMGAKDWGSWTNINKLRFGSRDGVALYVKANYNAEINGD